MLPIVTIINSLAVPSQPTGSLPSGHPQCHSSLSGVLTFIECRLRRRVRRSTLRSSQRRCNVQLVSLLSSLWSLSTRLRSALWLGPQGKQSGWPLTLSLRLHVSVCHGSGLVSVKTVNQARADAHHVPRAAHHTNMSGMFFYPSCAFLWIQSNPVFRWSLPFSHAWKPSHMRPLLKWSSSRLCRFPPISITHYFKVVEQRCNVQGITFLK